MELDLAEYKESHLRRLYTYLNYELSSSVLFILIFIPGAMFIINIAVLLFTPYMIYVLVRTRKTGWLISFIIFIPGPFITFRFVIPVEYNMIVNTLPVLFFFLYCFLLRQSVGEQLAEMSARRQYKIQKEMSRLTF